MTDNTSTVHLNVTDSGSIQKLTKEATKLRKELESSQKAANFTTRTPKPVAAAQQAIAVENKAGRQSGLARGIGGQTGAEGRDFAKQAEGLGGLVRVYAMLAANIFAATAAFGALSRAFDTYNMVKGLDQLGAASGRNLGSLAKRVAEVTDNAVSLRESLEAVTKASSAGLSSQQILRLGEAAKKTSQALGVNMTDALSRLSRGISKVEPELLDELGIFVRVDDAQKNYARSIGKSISALSDFERRQAFANAVLDQAEAKFKNINIDANPYTKLAASLQNTAQQGLELLNKVLGPIANILAQSPTALIAVLTGIGTVLLRQAIPALGQWRGNLRAAAGEAADFADKTAKTLGDKFQEKLNTIFSLPQLTTKLKLAEDQVNKLGAKSDIVFSNFSASKTLGKEGSTEVDNLNATNKLIEKRLKLSKELDSLEDSPAVRRRIKINLEKLQGERALAAQLEKNIAIEKAQSNLREVRATREKAFNAAETVAEGSGRGFLSKRFDPEELALRKAIDARQKYASINAIATASETANIAGVRIAWAELNKTIKDEGLTGLSKFFTLAKGGLAAVFSRVMGIVGSLGMVGQAAAILYGVFQLVDSFASGNKKQAEEASKAFGMLNDSIDNVGRTLDVINNKDPLGFISTESIMARSNALTDLVDNFSAAMQKMQKEAEKANGWDIALDWVARAFGGGKAKAYARDFANSIVSALSAAGRERSSSARNQLSALGLDPSNIQQMTKVFQQDPSKLSAAVNILKDLNREVGNVASSAQAMDDAFKQASKTLDAIFVAAIPTDPMAKLGMDMMNVSTTMVAALRDPTTAMQELVGVAGDVSKLRFFGEFGIGMIKQSAQIKKDVEAVSELTRAIDILKTKEEEINTKRRQFIEDQVDQYGAGASDTTKRLARSTAEFRAAQDPSLNVNDKLKADIAFYTNLQKDIISKIEPIILKFREQGVKLFAEGADKVNIAIGAGFAKAGIIISQAIASALGNTIGGISARGRAERASIDIDIQKLRSEQDLISINERLRIAVEASTDEYRRAALEANKNRTSAEDKELANLKIRAQARAETAGLNNFGAARRFLDQTAPADASNEEKLLLVAKQEEASKKVSFFNSKIAVSAQIAQKAAEKTASALNQEVAELNAQLAIRNDMKSVKLEENNLDKQKFEFSIRAGTAISQSSLEYRKQLELKTLQIAQEKELDEINTRRLAAQAALRIAKPDSKDAKDAQKAIDELNAAELRAKERQAFQRQGLNVKNTQFEIDNAKKLVDERIALDKQVFDVRASVAQAYYAAEEEKINYLQQFTLVSEATIAAQRGEVERKKELLSFTEKVASLDEARARTLNEIATKENGTNDRTQLNLLAQQRTLAEQVYSSGVANEKLLLDSKLKNIEATTKQNVTLAEQKELMDKVSSFADNLEVVFGKLGETVGSAVTKIVTVFQNLENARTKYADSMKELAAREEEIQKRNIPEEDKVSALKVIAKERQKIQDKQTDIELASYQMQANAFKSLFKEKTAAYKAFTVIEKTLAILRMANMIKEAAVALSTSTTVIATDQAKAQSGGITAIIKSMQDLPTPFNFIAGAAMTALVASIIGKSIGRGASAAPKGFSAEEQQKVQGTGQSFVNGQLVNRGGGALGDPTAKANSLENSINKIEEYSFSTLEYSNDMLKALKGIEKNTTGLSAILLQSGINFKGVNPDGSTKFGSSGPSTRGRGLSVASMLESGGIGLDNIFNLIGLSSDSGLGKGLAKLSNAIWGGKTKTELLDIGIQIEGNFNDIIKSLSMGGEDLKIVYENIKTTVSGGLFRPNKTTFDTVTSAAEKSQAEAFGVIFSGIGDTVTSAAIALGKSPEAAKSLLNGFEIAFKASLKDLKGEELTKALTEEFSVQFNRAAEYALPAFQQFRRPAEEFGDTIVRIAREVQLGSLAFEAAGLSVGDISKAGEDLGVTAVKVAEAFIDASGGLDSFIEKTNFFNENFRTEAQRLAPIQARVTAEMQRLNLTSVDTREGFAAAVTAAAALGESGAQLYADLLNVAEAFDKVAKAAEQQSSKQEEQVIQILKLEGRGSEAITKTREKELANLYKLDISLDKVLVEQQQYIYALEDSQQILDLTINAADKLGYSYLALNMKREREIGNLTGGARALQEFINATEDRNKSDAIGIEIMEAEGKSTEALTAKRLLELRGLSAVDQQLKIRLWRLQDEKKLLDQSRSQQVKILNLLGDAEGALAITRAQELEGLDAQLRPAQEYIYALEDQMAIKEKLKTAYEKETSALKETIKSLKDSSKALKEYKAELLQSDKSILTPTQKYQVAKSEALRLAAIAQGPAVSEAQIAVRDDAVSKLPAATDKWLEASRTLFASSESYTTDFNMVVGILDTVSGVLDGQQTDAQKQLSALENNTTILDIIKENTKSAADYLKEYLDAEKAAKLAKAAIPATPITATNVAATATADGSGGFVLTGTTGNTATSQELKDYINKDPKEAFKILVPQGLTSAMADIILGIPTGSSLRWALDNGLPAFAMGGLASGTSLVGERGPELVDFQNPGRVYSANSTATMVGNFNQLINEVKLLRNEVNTLRKEQAEQTGHLIGTNLEAANKTAEALEEATVKAAENQNWNARNTLKLA